MSDTHTTAAVAAAGDATYLVFRLGEEHYAAPVTDVEEVLEPQSITVVPRCPAYLLGIINVRGSLIPVMDLRKRFGVGAVGGAPEASGAANAEARAAAGGHIVVFRMQHGEERIQMGVVVDGVEGVVDLDEGSLEPPPRVGAELDGSVIQGMARHGERILLVVEADALLSKEQLDADFDRLEQSRREAAPG
jgi:purine-binding chemotaxis protein CheW